MSIIIKSHEESYSGDFTLLTSLKYGNRVIVNNGNNCYAEIKISDPDLEPVLNALRDFAHIKMQQAKEKDRLEKMEFVKTVLSEYPDCIGFNSGAIS